MPHTSNIAALRDLDLELEGYLAELERTAQAGGTLTTSSPLAPLLAGFEAKDQLYGAAAEALERAARVGPARLLRIFEPNLKLQTASFRSFYEALQRSPSTAARLGSMVRVLRERLETERRGIVPLLTKEATVVDTVAWSPPLAH